MKKAVFKVPSSYYLKKVFLFYSLFLIFTLMGVGCAKQNAVTEQQKITQPAPLGVNSAADAELENDHLHDEVNLDKKNSHNKKTTKNNELYSGRLQDDDLGDNNPASTKVPVGTKNGAAKIAIIIDDLGYKKNPGELIAALPYPITMAIIPGSPYAHDVAKFANDYNKELILHVPMETVHARAWEKGLTTDMTLVDLNASFIGMLEQYPSISGINNHGGSKFTADLEHMNWVMNILSQRNLYFLDSRTTSKSVGVYAASRAGVMHTSRDVFLDNVKSSEAISAEFTRLRRIARKTGQAVAIGHPHPETLKQLALQLPLLEKEGFKLTFCSQLLIDTPKI